MFTLDLKCYIERAYYGKERIRIYTLNQSPTQTHTHSTHSSYITFLGQVSQDLYLDWTQWPGSSGWTTMERIWMHRLVCLAGMRVVESQAAEPHSERGMYIVQHKYIYFKGRIH